MPEFNEQPNENPDQPEFDPEFLANLKKSDLGPRHDDWYSKSYLWGSTFVEHEEEEAPEPVEQFEAPEVSPNFTSSEEKLAHVLEKIHDSAPVEQFERAIVNMRDAATSERDKEDIRHFGEYHLWAMRGRDAEPPESVVAVRQDDSPLLKIERNPQVFTDADEDRFFSKHKYEYAESKYQQVNQKRLNELEQNKEEIMECLEEIVKDSPVYNFLQSLATENPYTSEDRPLNDLERTAHEAQAEAETKRQFGMGANENIIRGTGAANSLHRKNYQLDDEVVRRKRINSGDSSVEPIKQYFTDVVRSKMPDGWDSGIEGRPVQLTVRFDGNYYLCLGDSRSRDVITPGMPTKEVAGAVAEPFGSEGLDARVNELTALAALDELVSGDANSVDQLLYCVRERVSKNIFSDEVTWEHSAPHITKPLTGIKVYDQETYDREEAAHNAARKALETYEETTKNATERIFDWSFGLQEPTPTSELSNAPDLATNNSFVFDSKEAIENDEANVVGIIVGFEPDGIKRLIQPTDKNWMLPPASGNADLVFVTDNNSGFAGQDPQVPGYELNARTKNVYEFTKGQQEPYANCGVVIPLAGRQALAEEYQSLGLAKLSHDVTSGSQFTASDLAKAIRDNSDYYVPPEVIRVSEDPGLADFRPFVKDGKLQLQCSGASHLLKISLNKAFGEDSAEVIGGLSFGSNGQVTKGSAHGQTQFRNNGKTYILDATPGEASSRQLEARQVELIAKQSPEEKLAIQFSNLEKNLAAAFKVPDTTQLHISLSTLPDHDPSRRALEIVAGLNSRQDAAEYLEYVESIKQAVTSRDPRLEQLGIGKYSTQLLDLLSGQVQKAQALLSEMGR